MTILNDAFEWALTLEEEGYESGSESLNIPTPLHTAPCLYHISASDDLSFRPATLFIHQAYSAQWPINLNDVHYSLAFGSDDDSLIDRSSLHGRTEQSLPVEHQMACHLTDDSFQDVPSEEEEEVEEHF